jgi:hypothetical protein
MTADTALAVQFAVPVERIVRTAQLDCGVSSAREAERALGAFLQWFVLIPTIGNEEHHVMLRGPVDALWHAAILNTAFYRNLCDQVADGFIDHHPRDYHPPRTWVIETVARLIGAYGPGLSPLFTAWSPSTAAAMSQPEPWNQDQRAVTAVLDYAERGCEPAAPSSRQAGWR